MKHIAIATLLLALAPATLAQTNSPGTTAGNPVISTVRQLEERQSKNLIGAAEEMPADKYSYHPTPEQMSFAHLIIHVAEANNGMCARIAGEPPRETKLSESDSKDVLTKAVKDSFAYCEQVLAKADDSTAWPAGCVPWRTHRTRASGAYLSGDGLGRPLQRCRDVSCG